MYVPWLLVMKELNGTSVSALTNSRYRLNSKTFSREKKNNRKKKGITCRPKL